MPTNTTAKTPHSPGVEYHLAIVGDEIELRVTDELGNHETTILGRVDAGLGQAVDAHPDALRVGSGITMIAAEGFRDGEVLPWLTFGEECSDDEWEEWIDDDWELEERLERMALPDGYRLGRWRVRLGEGLIRVLTNGTRFIALSFPDGEDYAYESFPEPWEPMFEWSFSNESGGPCIWDGSCTGGLVAPDALMEFERGDQSPGIRLTLFKPEELRDILTAIAEDWAIPLLIGRSGLPGLTQQEREAVWGAYPDNSQVFSLTCSDELAQEVVDTLVASGSTLTDAQDALLNPDSELGRTVYAWFRGFAGSVPVGERVDWFTIFSALTGDLGDPIPLAEAELAQRTAAEEEARRRAEAAKRDAFEQLRKDIADAIAGNNPQAEVERLQARLERAEAQARKAAAARTLLGLSPDQHVLHRHVTERLSQKPGDHDWEAETWAAFWTVQEAYSAPSTAKLQAELFKAKDAVVREAELQVREERKALDDGWPPTWPWQLLRLWRARGGTVNSARAWAEAGYTAEEVLLGSPSSPGAMDGLTTRLRKRKPTPKA